MKNKKPSNDEKANAQRQAPAPFTLIDKAGDTPNHGEKSEHGHAKSVSEQAVVRLTRALVWWTAVLAAATVALGVIAFLQFLELRSTDRTTKQALTAVQRSFVFVKDTSWSPLVSDRKRNVGWSVSFEFENSGNTPTRNLQIEAFCPFNDKPVIDPHQLKTRDAAVQTKRLLGPKQSTGGAVCLFELDHINSVFTGKYVLYLVATATYRDVFNEEHVTEYCQEIIGLNVDPKTSSSLSTVNRPCETHNCTDEDCKRQK